MTMCIEDAEVLLENKKYIDCQRCALNTALGRRILNADCPECHAWSVVPNPMYVAAAQRAGLPVPQAMSKKKMAEIDGLMEKIKQRGIKADRVILNDSRYVYDYKTAFDDY
jgi:hypothetical protein